MRAVKDTITHYWKREETETPWTQPVLSANGTIGGDSFACAASFEGSAYPAWKAFDNNTGDNSFWGSGNSYPVWLEWYNPNSIKISNIKITNGIDIYGDVGNLCDFYIQGSDDGNVWENVYTGVNRTSGVKLVTNIDLSLSKSYKFWRLYCLNDYSYQQVTTSNGVDISEIKITATTVEETITPGTAQDYDFYTTEEVYKAVQDAVTHYWQYTWGESSTFTPEGEITATSGWSNVTNAFDGASSTYASCGTLTDYIDVVLNTPVKITSFNASGIYAAGAARACNVAIYNVVDGVETLIANGTGASQRSTYNTGATFSEVEASHLRFYLISGPNGNPTTSYKTRIIEITLTGKKQKIVEVTSSDPYDYTTTENIYKGVNQ